MLNRPTITASAGLLLGILSGCSTQLPSVRPDAEAAAAIGLQDKALLSFQIDGQADDVSANLDELDIAKVLELTASKSPKIQTALARVRASLADAKQARLLPNPVLNVAVRFPESGSSIIDAGVSAELLSLLRRPGTIGSADAKLRAASAQAVSVVLDELAEAQESFYTVQSLEASNAVLKERRDLLDRLISLAESRLRIGEGSRLDVVTLQTQRVVLEVELSEKELELREERLRLARMIGEPSSQASWMLPTWRLPESPLLDESACVKLAIERRPEVQERFWELESLGYQRRLASWDLLNGATVGVDAERDGDWSVGPAASVPIPLLDMGQAQRERAQALVIEARHQLTLARRQVIEETRRAFFTLMATKANLDRVRDKLIPLQEDRLKQAEAQFRAGQTDVTSLLVAEQDLRASRSQLFDLQRRVAIARVRLDRAVGGSAYLSGLQPTTAPTK